VRFFNFNFNYGIFIAFASCLNQLKKNGGAVILTKKPLKKDNAEGTESPVLENGSVLLSPCSEDDDSGGQNTSLDGRSHTFDLATPGGPAIGDVSDTSTPNYYLNSKKVPEL